MFSCCCYLCSSTSELLAIFVLSRMLEYGKERLSPGSSMVEHHCRKYGDAGSSPAPVMISIRECDAFVLLFHPD